MKRISIIVWSLAFAACVPIKPPQTTEPPQPPQTYTVAAVVADQHGTRVQGAHVTLEPGAVTFTTTNALGYAAAQLPAGATFTLLADTDCCGVAKSDPFTVTANRDVYLMVTRPDPPQPARPPIKTWAETPAGTAACNFGSGRDAQDRNIFTPFIADLWEQGRISEAEQWLSQQAREGNNCLVLMVESRGYPGYFLPAFDFRGRLDRMNTMLDWLQGYAAADGAAWRFVIHATSGDEDRQTAWDELPALAAAFRSKRDVIIWSNGFETLRSWRPANLSKFWTRMHLEFGDGQRTMAWGLPNAVSGASFMGEGSENEPIDIEIDGQMAHFEPCKDRGDEAGPYHWIDYHDANRPGLGGCVQADDPWQGDEPSSVGTHGAEFITDWAFQTEHGRAVIDPCGRSVDDGRGRGLKYPDGCSMGRFDDLVARLGAQICTDDYGAGGRCGWARKIVWLMETDTFDAFRNNSTPAIAERIANQGEVICAFYGVPCNYGSGAPTSMRPKR